LKNFLLVGADMPATLSPEFQVATILDSIGCVVSNFSEIADRHANSRVIAALRGANDFDPEDGQYYLSLARQMKHMAEEFPVPIDWRKTQRIKEIIAARRTTARPVPFEIVRFSDGTLFQKMENGKAIQTTDYSVCAAIKSFETARAIVKLLDRMGYMCNQTRITNVRREDIFDSIRDFGFTETAA
jgi:hypothetical protein